MGEVVDRLKQRKDLPQALAQALETMAATMDEQTLPVECVPAEPESQVIQLPLWPEPVRGTPNSFLRSALFAAIQGKTRAAMKKEILAAAKGIEIRFTGFQLDQADLDVWEQAVHLARRNELGNVCRFRANAFLKAIGRSNGKANYEWLNDSLTRLVACAVEIRNGSRVFTGSLLSSCERDENTGMYELILDPKTIRLYSFNDWTAIDWEQRKALKGKPLALWLHGFYSSHAQPFPLSIDYLREKSGSRTQEKKFFKTALKRAFIELENVTGIKAQFEGDLVIVERLPTPVQARHILNQLIQRKKAKK